MGKKSGLSQTRRNLLKGLAALPFAGSFSISSAASLILSKDQGYLTEEAKTSLKDLKGVLPKGKLGKYEVSRIVLGCNPMGGWAHSRDLPYVGQLSKRWHTETKMKETWAVAEQAGVNLCNLGEFQYKAFNEYKKETGGKMLNNCQCIIGQPNDRLAPVRKAVDDGADMIYIQGENVDGLAKNNAIDVLLETIDYIRSQGLPAGVGAHSLKSLEASVKAGVKPDFYFKTFHHDKYWSATPREYRTDYTNYSSAPVTDRNQWNDNMWDQYPEQTIEFFKSIDVPFFGFKVLAAGSIQPANGIRWAFENGADFICLGMYDFQVVDDVNSAIDVLANLGKRERKWYA
ncbi:MAG: hypothetical protein NTW82_00555 [Bacteroidia bacterium]|nr:hypothetical protein [Bacteroidia bacterium]